MTNKMTNNFINSNNYKLTTNQNCISNLNNSFNEYTLTTPATTKLTNGLTQISAG